MLSFKKFDIVARDRFQYCSLFGASLGIKTSMAHLSPLIVRSRDVGNGFMAIPVEYQSSESFRLQAVSPAALQYMPRDVRNWLVPAGAVDLDIVNSAPVLLSSVAARHGIQCLYLDEFAKNPGRLFSTFHGGNSKSELKGMVLFGDPSINLGESFKPVREDVQRIYLALVDLPAYRHIRDAVDRLVNEERPKKKQKTGDNPQEPVAVSSPNRQGKFLSRLYFHWESEIMACMIRAAYEEGHFNVSHSTLVYDGLIIHPRHGVEIQDIIHHLQSAVNSEYAFDIELKAKPMPTSINQDLSKAPEEIVISGGDDHAANVMAFLLRDDLVKSGDFSLFARTQGGLWIGGGAIGSKNPAVQWTRNAIANANLKCEFNDTMKPFGLTFKTQNDIMGCLWPKLPTNTRFVRDLVFNSKLKLRFTNGYYQFGNSLNEKTGCYGEFKEGQEMDSMVQINYTFPRYIKEDVEFVMDNVLKPIFDGTEEGLLETFLCDVARAMAGHADKTTIMMTGQRNCGKSIIGQFITTILGDYTTKLPATILGYRANGGDGLTDCKWVCDIESVRIGMVSEGKETEQGSGVRFSSEVIKQVQSLKEGIKARQIFDTQKVYYSLMALLVMMNEVPLMDCEAAKMFRIYSILSKFVSAEEKAAKPFNIEWKIRNEEVEAWSQSPVFKHYQDAFLHIVLKAYRPYQMPLLSNMQAEVDDIVDDNPLVEAIERVIQITGNQDEYVPVSEIKKSMKSVFPSIETRMREFNQTLFSMIREHCKDKSIIIHKAGLHSLEKFRNCNVRIDGKLTKVYLGIALK